MPRLTSKTVLASVALATVGLLSGCGGAQPGVAVRLGDDTISVGDVNEVSDGICEALRGQFQSGGTVVPKSVLTGIAVRALTINVATDQLAEAYGVEVTESFRQSQADLEQAASSLNPESARSARVLLDTGTQYRDDILRTIGRSTLEEEGVSDPSVDDSLARGLDIYERWLADHDLEIDPQYHLEVADQIPAFADTSTSFALSADAEGGLLADQFAERELDPESEAPAFESYARSLPQSQRCG